MDSLSVIFYKGFDGKTLLIRTNQIEDLLKLKNVFIRLSKNDNDEVRLSNIIAQKTQGVKDVIMSNCCTYVDTRIKHDTLYWEQSPTDWYNDEGLLSGLISSAEEGENGHQYFGSSITIEISYNEL